MAYARLIGHARTSWNVKQVTVNITTLKYRYVGSACAFLAFTCAAGCSPSTPQPLLTACHVRQHPEQYDGKSVSIAAELNADLHRVVLTDPSCPNLGLEVQYSERFLKSGDADRFSAVVREQALGTSERSVSVTLSGTFLAAKSIGEAATIELDHVQDLIVR